MNIIKTSLAALTIIIGFSSNAQDTKERKSVSSENVKTSMTVSPINLVVTPEVIANKRADELNSKVALSEEQLTKVKELFLKVENRKEALKNSDATESEKNNALIELQKMEDAELQTILSPVQKKIITDSKAEKKAASM